MRTSEKRGLRRIIELRARRWQEAKETTT